MQRDKDFVSAVFWLVNITLCQKGLRRVAWKIISTDLWCAVCLCRVEMSVYLSTKTESTHWDTLCPWSRAVCRVLSRPWTSIISIIVSNFGGREINNIASIFQVFSQHCRTILSHHFHIPEVWYKVHLGLRLETGRFKRSTGLREVHAIWHTCLALSSCQHTKTRRPGTAGATD